MNNIRFRAWHFKMNQMFSPEVLAEDQLTLLATGQFINVSSISTSLSVLVGLDTMIPLQSTELFDKNGKEIFVGDIIEFSNGQRRVKMDEWMPNTMTIEIKSVLSTVGFRYVSSSLKILGNIYENPELLPTK